MKYGAWNRKLEVVTAALTAALAALLIFQATPGQNYKSQLSLGNRFLTAGNYEKAEAAFNAAIKIDSKQADPYIGLGSVYVVQADVILNQYQSGTASGNGETSGLISTEEKERMEELYRKAQEAWKHASELDSGNEDAEQALAYVEQQQEQAGKLKTNADSDSDAEVTPTPEPDLEDLVDLNGGSTTELEENQIYTDFDLDGDGTADSIEVETRNDDPDVSYIETTSRILIDDAEALNFHPRMDMGGGIGTTDVTVLQMNTGNIFIGTCLTSVDDGNTFEVAIYSYQNGQLEKLFDLKPFDDGREHNYGDAYDIKSEGNTIQFSIRMQPYATGVIEMTRSLIYHDGILEFLGNEADVSGYQYSEITNESKDIQVTDTAYSPARIAIPCYETGTSQTVELTIEPGTMCKVTKAYFENGMHLRRFCLETEDGRSGWFNEDINTTEEEYGTMVPVFYGHGFAQ